MLRSGFTLKGVANATVKNSVMGHMSMNIFGYGTFLVENTKYIISNNQFMFRNVRITEK